MECFWGCGYLIRVLPDKEILDVGMWVNPVFRRQGYATLIISHLKETCLKAGYTPIAGCAADNIVSKNVGKMRVYDEALRYRF